MSSAYLSLCAIYRDEAPYLREWVEFHRLVGVERFFMYDNGSTDDHREALAPYVDGGIVTLYDWPLYPGQLKAYEHCVEEHGHQSRWIAFLDLDEFLFSPAGRPLPEVLVDYEPSAGVAVNWVVFGTSGHRTKPPGLVIENFVCTGGPSHPSGLLVKSIVDPTRVVGCRNPHYFRYGDDGHAVDEQHRRVRFARSESHSVSRLRINHYFTKSEAEFRKKLAKGKADTLEGRPAAQQNFDTIIAGLAVERDEVIAAYVPALREALTERVDSPSGHIRREQREVQHGG
jgi:hypothetical protein